MLARRKSGGDMGGRWELPGGKCEGSESPMRALAREFQEELGLTIKVGAQCASAMFRHAGKDHNVLAFWVYPQGEMQFMAEHDEIRWFSLHELPGRQEIVDSDADLLYQIRALNR